MNTFAEPETAPASPLEHGLRPHFQALARFDSTRALEASPLSDHDPVLLDFVLAPGGE